MAGLEQRLAWGRQLLDQHGLEVEPCEEVQPSEAGVAQRRRSLDHHVVSLPHSGEVAAEGGLAEVVGHMLVAGRMELRQQVEGVLVVGRVS
jgi:hypothetical protein